MINKAVIRLGPGCRSGVVELDGTDIAAGVRALTFAARVGELHMLTIDVPVLEVELEGDEVTWAMSDRTRQALQVLGWTPPADSESTS